MLFILDGLWGFPWHGSSSRPTQWQNTPFNNDYPSSILMSQDMVAIDSVALDFLRAEFADNMGGRGRARGAIDDYLHEAALANDPCSGTIYDPEADGIPLESLGVHEHWNNPLDKNYSRNLNPNSAGGIELICSAPQIPLAGDSDKKRTVNALDPGPLTTSLLSSDAVAGPNYNPSCVLSDDKETNSIKFAIFPHFLLQKN